jgi:tetratricopeptide (TPR) repeat protein
MCVLPGACSCSRVLYLGAVLPLILAAGALAAEPAEPTGPNLLMGPPPRVATPRPAEADEAMYDRCMKLARDNPAAARELAEAMVSAPAALRAGVFAQAAQARLLDGDPGHAYADDGAALALHPDDPDTLVDRAEAAGSAGWFDKAVSDLDKVLKAEPSRLEALIYRASAYRELGRLDPALADIEQALKLEPNSVPALLERGNIRGLKGDLDGARQDWSRVAALAPGSPAEIAAKANLGHLDEPPQAAPSATPASPKD